MGAAKSPAPPHHSQAHDTAVPADQRVAVKRHQLRRQLSHAADETRCQVSLRAITAMWSAYSISAPVPGGPKGAVADNRVIDVLREFITKRLTHLHIRFTVKSIGAREAAQIRYSFEVLDNQILRHIGTD